LKKFRPFFTIVLVLDFASPKVPPLLKQKFTPRGDYKKVIVYPLRASSPSTDVVSDCNHVIGLNVKPEEIAPLGKQWTYKPDTALPLSEAIRKIEFEVEYHLRTLDQIIFVTNDKKDSCGEDPCQALSHLRATARKLKRKIQFQIVGPLQCPKEKNDYLMVMDSTALSLPEVVANGKGLKTTPATDLPMEKMPVPKPKPKPNPSPNASKRPLASPSSRPSSKPSGSPSGRPSSNPSTKPSGKPSGQPSANPSAQSSGFPSPTPSLSSSPLPSTSPSPSGSPGLDGEILDNDFQLDGPPLTITLTRDKQVLRLTSPTITKVPTGDWDLKIVTPSWLKDVPPKKIHIDERVLYQMDLKDGLKDSLVWVDSLDEEDQIIILGDIAHQRKILVPSGSPSVPLAKGSQWKVVK
jgi:hypothetical protein